MKISAVLPKGVIKNNEASSERINIKIFFALALALIEGTVIYIASESYLSSEMLDSFKGFFSDFSSKSMIEVFTGLVLTNLPFLIFSIILGSSTSGYIIIPLMGFLKITGIGVVNTYIYSAFGLKGVEYSLLVFYPGKFLLMFSFLFLMQACIENSLRIKNIAKGECRAEKYSISYAVKIIAATITMLLSSVVDCILIAAFSKLFSF